MTPKVTALIIEDEKSIRSFIETTLNANGYKVFTAASGQEGLSFATSNCPDVILLDLGLPDIDGLHIIKQIREWSVLPIIVISARTQEKEKVAALDAGADDYITKPFGTSELLARIRTALRHHHLQTSGSGKMPNLAYQYGGLIIDYEKRLVTLNGQTIH